MKKIWFSSLLLVSLGVNAQTDTAAVKTDSAQLKKFELPDSTAIGTPDGKLVSKEIGTAGGTIISDDGRVELIFPEGALTTNTAISIQPVTNMLNGSGKAYQMEPSGTQFEKPVEIIFTYTDEEAETCPPDLKSFALQDSKGKWTFFEYAEWDSTTKKLSGFIHHFSTLVTDQSHVWMRPNYDDIWVKGRLVIWVLHSFARTGTGKVGFPIFASDDRGLFVNGIKDGNRLVGKANLYAGGDLIEYYAPEMLPRANPVEIKMAFKYHSRIKKKVVWGTAKCKIIVYDDYKITIIKKGQSILECGAELEDMSSFKVKLYGYKKPEITDVINSEPTLTRQADCSGETRGGRRRGSGYPLKYDPAGCRGPVHVDGSRLTGHGITYNQTETAPEITIEFAPDIVKIMNSKGKLPEEKKEFAKAVDDVNVGTRIKFKANRSFQEYNEPGPGSFGELSFKLIINPL